MVALTLPMKPLTKRTRISRGQSKNGCFTCKSRKVKCDEQKPHCTRCKNARIRCEGYPPSAYYNSSRSSSADSYSATRESVHKTFNVNNASHVLDLATRRFSSRSPSKPATQQDLYQTGLDLLLKSYDDHFVLGQSALRRLLNRHCSASLAVHAACAALGAATQLQHESPHEPEQLKIHFATQYGLAIRIVRQELENQYYDTTSILTTCVVLASVERILRRCKGASVHLRGAYQALQSSMLLHHNLDIYQAQAMNQVSDASLDDTEVDCDVLLRVFDVQYLTSTGGYRYAALKPVSLETLDSLFYEAYRGEITDRQLVPTIHAALLHLSPSFLEGMGSPSSFGAETQKQQFVILLQRWTTLLETRLFEKHVDIDRLQLILHYVWVLHVTILLSAYFNEHATAWDMHAREFQQIISLAEEAIQIQHRLCKGQRDFEPGLRFTPLSGIMVILHTAAIHYRHPTWRRRAIACLRQIDRQGPFAGEMLSALSERVLEIEELHDNQFEMALGSSDLVSDITTLDTIDTELLVPEQARVSFCFVLDEHSNVNSSQWPTTESGSVEIKFMRRKRPAPLLNALTYAVSQTNSGIPGVRSYPSIQLDAEDWELWTERIDFSPGSPHKVLWSTREQKDGGHVTPSEPT